MIIIAGNSHSKLALAVATNLSVEFISAQTKRFDDQELRIQIDGNVYEQDIVIIQSTSKPANDHLMELLLLADTVKRAGARRIVAVIPYFGYSRQDRPSYSHGPISASLVATLIEAAGISRVITFDLHSRQAEGFFSIGVQNLDSLALFVPLLHSLKKIVIVSPDVGGFTRAQKFSSMLGVDLAVINKSRTVQGDCIMSDVIGNIAGKNCVLVDDIIDTGGTICTAAALLLEKGALSVSACITHAVLSGECQNKLQAAQLHAFYVTDSINHDDLVECIQVVSIADSIAQTLKRFI